MRSAWNYFNTVILLWIAIWRKLMRLHRQRVLNRKKLEISCTQHIFYFCPFSDTSVFHFAWTVELTLNLSLNILFSIHHSKGVSSSFIMSFILLSLPESMLIRNTLIISLSTILFNFLLHVNMVFNGWPRIIMFQKLALCNCYGFKVFSGHCWSFMCCSLHYKIMWLTF